MNGAGSCGNNYLIINLYAYYYLVCVYHLSLSLSLSLSVYVCVCMGACVRAFPVLLRISSTKCGSCFPSENSAFHTEIVKAYFSISSVDGRRLIRRAHTGWRFLFRIVAASTRFVKWQTGVKIAIRRIPWINKYAIFIGCWPFLRLTAARSRSE